MLKQLTTPQAKASNFQIIFWLSLSLAFAAHYSILGYQQSLGQYFVQDDARQHVFWMRRFLDPELFPQDLIADYFQSVAPWGYSNLYKVFATIGIDPIVLSKYLPIALGLITTAYCFGVCLEILPVPVAGFMAAVMLNQNLWIEDDLVSATPRAFIYPLLLGFLYYLLRGSLLPCLIAIALQGLFYPQSVFISSGILILRVLQWETRRRGDAETRRRGDGETRRQFSIPNSQFPIPNSLFPIPNSQFPIPNSQFLIPGLGVALLVLLPYAVRDSPFGPIITVDQAKSLPEFWSGGRSTFFRDHPWLFWLGGRSGILPDMPVTPLFFLTGFLLPILLRYPSRFPLVKEVRGKVVILAQLMLASLGMFVAAHLFLFKLHLPNRYTSHSYRITIALAAAIALTLILDAIVVWAQGIGNWELGIGNWEQGRGKGLVSDIYRGWCAACGVALKKPGFWTRQVVAVGIAVLLGMAITLHPYTWRHFPRTQYQLGQLPELYEFFAQQPKDILIASVAEEANNLPTFAQRSILVGSEYAIPYHTGYYEQFRKRVLDLIKAQYSPNLAEVQEFIAQYKVDFWLLDLDAFTPEYLAENQWLQQFKPVVKEAQIGLEEGRLPALTLREDCLVFQTEGLVVLEAGCVANSKFTIQN
ncbi:MAG: hypothetical protein F6K47_25860 [Symploca sp. SIO2E6]|nr:hypothetical protein [Symploca sp. SIO2E6]